MGATIDHLRVDYRVVVLQDFTDATGVTLRAGESGILRRHSFDAVRLEIQLEIEREQGSVALRFPLRATDGPRLGHMTGYFELGDYTPIRGSEASRAGPRERRMIVPPPGNGFAASAEGPDRLEAVETQILRDARHLGGAASVAEMYAQRMRAFQRAGNEARAVAAFRLAAHWMWTYASQATSGGEGEALSRERDGFHAGLVREFGYDPTVNER